MTAVGFINSPNYCSISIMLAFKRISNSTVISALRCNRMHRFLSTQTDGEVRIAEVLKDKFPLASKLKVVDISGGCGAMYEIHVESSEFKGKRTVQQHQLVNQALKDEIQGMHGLRIFTDIPKQ